MILLGLNYSELKIEYHGKLKFRKKLHCLYYTQRYHKNHRLILLLIRPRYMIPLICDAIFQSTQLIHGTKVHKG